ncbi:carbohydrate binding protein with CBM15 domain [Micromonospora palomenae]|uniref:Carbohydrate binding protein with CBM15 domain n=1 Tax=Micromonospora palomenae TaxID=1461247 RepID=A0A561WW28_9ACTN|nr:IniB N-terminal domain-containing protein [Micromonospora palomenae]TWG28074.1 carbohydrate binding protein with CBM15 domain [Micromonospora palomenae]
MSASASTNSTADGNPTSAADWTGNTEATADTSATINVDSTASAGSTAEMGAAADMVSPQSLQDFVLGLLTNVDARAAYEADPQGALDNAGLNDVTPADVQDIVPLVSDYVPVQGITSLLSEDSLGVSAATTVDGLGLSGATSTLGGLDLTGVTGHLGGTLDSTAGGLGVSGVTGDLGGTAYGATGLVSDVTGDLGGTVHGLDSVTGDVGVHSDAYASADGELLGGLL